MVNVRFNTRYRTFTSSPKETIVAASETLPDETLSIPEILARYVRQGATNVDTSYPAVQTEDDVIYQQEMDFGKPAQEPAQEPSQEPSHEPSHEPAQEPAQEPAENSTK